jgi:hypothetical protein
MKLQCCTNLEKELTRTYIVDCRYVHLLFFFLKNIIFACGNEDHSTIIPQV